MFPCLLLDWTKTQILWRCPMLDRITIKHEADFLSDEVFWFPLSQICSGLVFWSAFLSDRFGLLEGKHTFKMSWIWDNVNDSTTINNNNNNDDNESILFGLQNSAAPV